MRRTAPTHTDARPEFRFTTPLTATATRPALYAILIPARVSAAIGRRGPIPIVAVFNQCEELQASLVPIGGGRPRLQLNARLRAALGVSPGARLRVELFVPDTPDTLPVPADLLDALREADLAELFAALPPGKRNHIVESIETAIRADTRVRRIALTIEVLERRRESKATRTSGQRSSQRR